MAALKDIGDFKEKKVEWNWGGQERREGWVTMEAK